MSSVFSFINSDHFTTLGTVVTLQLLAVISPGPDFAVVTKNSILYSRQTGLCTALGITAGVLFHIIYLVLGFGFLVASLGPVLSLVKVGGCLYLGYLGWKGITAAPSTSSISDLSGTTPGRSNRSAFWNGFLTNVLNPKAILFLLSLFTVVISPLTPTSILVLCGALIIAITWTWFFLVVCLFSGKLRQSLLRWSYWIDRLTGGFLLLIAIQIGWSFWA